MAGGEGADVIVCEACGEQDFEGGPYCLNPSCGARLNAPALEPETAPELAPSTKVDDVPPPAVEPAVVAARQEQVIPAEPGEAPETSATSPEPMMRKTRRLRGWPRPRHVAATRPRVGIGRLLLPFAAVLAVIVGAVATWFFAQRSANSATTQPSGEPVVTASASPAAGEPFITSKVETFCRQGTSWGFKVQIELHNATSGKTIDFMHVSSSGALAYSYQLGGDGRNYSGEVPPQWAIDLNTEHDLRSPDTRWRVELMLAGEKVKFNGGTLTNPC